MLCWFWVDRDCYENCISLFVQDDMEGSGVNFFGGVPGVRGPEGKQVSALLVNC